MKRGRVSGAFSLAVVCIVGAGSSCSGGGEPTSGRQAGSTAEGTISLTLEGPRTIRVSTKWEDVDEHRFLIRARNNKKDAVALFVRGDTFYVAFYDARGNYRPEIDSHDLPEYSPYSVSSLRILGPGEELVVPVYPLPSYGAKPGKCMARAEFYNQWDAIQMTGLLKQLEADGVKVVSRKDTISEFVPVTVVP